jgi:hypothetical protein
MSHLIGVDLDATYTSAQLTERGLAVGAITEHDGKKYKLYLFNNGAGDVAAVSGNVAYIYAVSGASAGQTNTCTMDLTDTQEIGAGVFQSVPADGEYCWLQVTGPATLTTALTAGADGDPLTPTGSTDGTLDVVTAATDAVCAYAIDASAKIVMCAFPH